jgi:hypothetical protein
MKPERAVERSIDTLQRIYAVVAGLAINEALKRVFLQDGKGEYQFHVENLPEFIAFIVTVVPFVHGMNRHLDRTLAASANRPGLLTFLLVDLLVFIIESTLLFVLAVTVTHPDQFFTWLIALLAVDAIWGLITWPITKTVVLQWLVLNTAIGAMLGAALCWLPADLGIVREWIMAALAVLRTILDYSTAWTFYFPLVDLKTGGDKPQV